MDFVALGLALGSFVATMGTWVVYFSKVPGGAVPARPVGSVILQVLAILLAVGAVGWNLQATGSVHAVVILPALLGVGMAVFFLWLLTLRKTPIGDLRVAVGDQLLAFEAVTSEGIPFRSEDLLGKRTLLKFFRGGW